MQEGEKPEAPMARDEIECHMCAEQKKRADLLRSNRETQRRRVCSLRGMVRQMLARMLDSINGAAPLTLEEVGGWQSRLLDDGRERKPAALASLSPAPPRPETKRMD